MIYSLRLLQAARDNVGWDVTFDQNANVHVVEAMQFHSLQIQNVDTN